LNNHNQNKKRVIYLLWGCIDVRLCHLRIGLSEILSP